MGQTESLKTAGRSRGWNTWTGVVHHMASQAPEWWTPCIRSEIMPTGQHLKLTDGKFSTSPYHISERTQYIRSATPWKSVVLSSLPTYWDIPLYKWRTVYLLVRRFVWCMRPHSKTENVYIEEMWRTLDTSDGALKPNWYFLLGPRFLTITALWSETVSMWLEVDIA